MEISILADIALLASSAVILPQVMMGDGASVGGLSLVKRNLEPWTLYAGVPARELGKRDKEMILAAEQEFRNELRRDERK